MSEIRLFNYIYQSCHAVPVDNQWAARITATDADATKAAGTKSRALYKCRAESSLALSYSYNLQ